MRPIQCLYCGTFEPTSEHFTNLRCSLRPSEIGRELAEQETPSEALVELQLIEKIAA
jgi:hypothetical protein